MLRFIRTLYVRKLNMVLSSYELCDTTKSGWLFGGVSDRETRQYPPPPITSESGSTCNVPDFENDSCR